MNNPASPTSSSQVSHYVAIGASAGGLEALQQLLSELPCDTGAGFIIVQHLSPDFKSLIAELLSKHTTMPVHNAEHGEEVKKNSICIIPPKKTMFIRNGCLELAERAKTELHHLPINTFFKSLADDQSDKSIAVILSGTGSDGCLGIRAIKEQGGLVIVQSPSSAKFDGMPLNALNTGVVDLVADPDHIGSHITSYINHPLIKTDGERLQTELQKHDRLLPEVFNILNERSKIDFSVYKSSTVARRIERRMMINQMDSLQEYLSVLFKNSSEADTLCRELLIGVTRFFRDTEVFKAIEKAIVNQLIELASHSRPIRIWIAGCSTGEEAYSIAMLFKYGISQRGISVPIKIFATDVDAGAIAKASTSAYAEEIINDVPDDFINHYFVKRQDRYFISPEIRNMVVFATHNLITDPPFSNMDLVLCRNVLIYFQQNIQRKVLAGFHFALNDAGYLCLGSSESLGDLDIHFESVDNSKLRIFKKVSDLRLPFTTSPVGANYASGDPKGRVLAPVSKALQDYRSGSSRKSEGKPLEELVDRYVPPCVLLDDNFNALHVYGDVSHFFQQLPPGKVSININDIIIEELSIAVSTALHRARQSGEDVSYTNVIESDNDASHLDIAVLNANRNDKDLLSGRYYWLIFETLSGKELIKGQKISFDKDKQARQRILDLELELKKNREHLQVTIEELETTNEELQSANEELMSANEELQSTNEELQSVNEELITVNSEHQEKIDEISQANSDLDHVLKASGIGIIFLDQDMYIRRFTNAVSEFVSLVASDVGRPIDDIQYPKNYSNFIADIRRVSSEGGQHSEKIEMDDGRTLWVNIAANTDVKKSRRYPLSVVFNTVTC